MGLLRLYLALCVVAAHWTQVLPWQMHNGTEAVQLFFIISGFYMQFIYDAYPSAKSFYVSRAIRIYLPYWITLAAITIGCLACYLIFDNLGSMRGFRDAFQANGLVGIIYATLSNITLFGIDTVFFVQHPIDGAFSLTGNFENAEYPLYRYLLIPQAWTIGVELTFYLLVPILIRFKSRNLLAIILLSGIARIVTYQFRGDELGPWGNRFFPFEIAIFIFGMLGARLYAHPRFKDFLLKIKQITRDKTQYIPSAICLMIFFWIATSITHSLTPIIEQRYAFFFSYPIWALLIPIIFHISRHSKIDRLIGELSYPVYLVHHFVIFLVAKTILVTGIELSPLTNGIANATISIAIAIGMTKFLIIPLDRYRHSKSARKDKATPSVT